MAATNIFASQRSRTIEFRSRADSPRDVAPSTPDQMNAAEVIFGLAKAAQLQEQIRANLDSAGSNGRELVPVNLADEKPEMSLKEELELKYKLPDLYQRYAKRQLAALAARYRGTKKRVLIAPYISTPIKQEEPLKPTQTPEALKIPKSTVSLSSSDKRRKKLIRFDNGTTGARRDVKSRSSLKSPTSKNTVVKNGILKKGMMTLKTLGSNYETSRVSKSHSPNAEKVVTLQPKSPPKQQSRSKQNVGSSHSQIIRKPVKPLTSPAKTLKEERQWRMANIDASPAHRPTDEAGSNPNMREHSASMSPMVSDERIQNTQVDRTGARGLESSTIDQENPAGQHGIITAVTGVVVVDSQSIQSSTQTVEEETVASMEDVPVINVEDTPIPVTENLKHDKVSQIPNRPTDIISERQRGPADAERVIDVDDRPASKRNVKSPAEAESLSRNSSIVKKEGHGFASDSASGTSIGLSHTSSFSGGGARGLAPRKMSLLKGNSFVQLAAAVSGSMLLNTVANSKTDRSDSFKKNGWVNLAVNRLGRFRRKKRKVVYTETPRREAEKAKVDDLEKTLNEKGIKISRHVLERALFTPQEYVHHPPPKEGKHVRKGFLAELLSTTPQVKKEEVKTTPPRKVRPTRRSPKKRPSSIPKALRTLLESESSSLDSLEERMLEVRALKGASQVETRWSNHSWKAMQNRLRMMRIQRLIKQTQKPRQASTRGNAVKLADIVNTNTKVSARNSRKMDVGVDPSQDPGIVITYNALIQSHQKVHRDKWFPSRPPSNRTAEMALLPKRPLTAEHSRTLPLKYEFVRTRSVTLPPIHSSTFTVPPVRADLITSEHPPRVGPRSNDYVQPFNAKYKPVVL